MALTQVDGGLLSPTNGQYTGFKSRIINGAMMIDQRNAGASVTATGYNVDRWSFQASQASKFTIQQNAGAVTPPNGFTNYLGFTVASAVTVDASDYFNPYQVIEGFNMADFGWGTTNAQTVTLSFWVRCSLTGAFSGSLQGGNSRSYPFSFMISAANTWEQKTVTIPGETTGTWNKTNGYGVGVYFNLGTGSTYLQPAGAWSTAASGAVGAAGSVNLVGTSGATFYITGVQLEKGSTATSFDYRPYGTELALCQRYLPAFKGINNWFGFGVASNASRAYCTIQYPVPTRVAPTGVTVSDPAHFSMTDAVANINTATSITFNSSGTSSGLLVYTCGPAAYAAFRPTDLYATSASANLYMTGCEL